MLRRIFSTNIILQSPSLLACPRSLTVPHRTFYLLKEAVPAGWWAREGPDLRRGFFITKLRWSCHPPIFQREIGLGSALTGRFMCPLSYLVAEHVLFGLRSSSAASSSCRFHPAGSMACCSDNSITPDRRASPGFWASSTTVLRGLAM